MSTGVHVSDSVSVSTDLLCALAGPLYLALGDASHHI